MAEIFWNKWSKEDFSNGIEHLFDSILLKIETPFPNLVIVPEFKENEKILILISIPANISNIFNQMLIYITDKVLSIIPPFCNTNILIQTNNIEIEDIWREKYDICKFFRFCNFIELEKPDRYYSPFINKQPGKDYLKNWYIPEEFVFAEQIIPIIPLIHSPVFKIHGIISSIFWFLPTKLKNEILIQKNHVIRTNAFMEIFSKILTKITLSGLIYNGKTNFAVLGNDPASVDAFGSALMAIKASSVPTTKYCKSHKICMGDLLKIHVQGERFQKPIVNDPFFYKETFQLLFNANLCNLCKRCIDVCPFQSIFYKEKIIFYNKTTCNRCGYCVEICPKEAIQEI